MAVQYLIKKIRTCPVCKGLGTIQNPIWAEFWKKYPIENPPEHEEMVRWFAENGFAYDMTMRTDGLPDEEISCGECDGEGEITSEVELLTAINELAGRYDHA